MIFTFVSETVIPNVGILIGIILTFIFIFVGVLFDMIGIAVTTSDEAQFHSMASKKVKGGMGLNIGIGLVLSFSYILFMTVTSSFAVSGLTSPRVAMWIPNIIYSIIAIILYRRASVG